MTQEPIYLVMPITGDIKPILCTTRPLLHKWIERNLPGLEFKTVVTPHDFKIIEVGTHYCAASGKSQEECWSNFKSKKHLGKPVNTATMVSLAETFARLVKMEHGVEFKPIRNKVRSIY